MDLFLRYRNAAILIAALVVQLVLLGYQVRQEDGNRLLSTWAVGLMAPFNNGIDGAVDYGASAWSEYIWLVGARRENETLRDEVEQLRLRNRALQTELERTERSAVLADYQEGSPSRTLLAEIIGGGASSASKEVILNKGTDDGVLAGMAIITASGIAGHVQAAHGTSSLAVLINDAESAVGAILGDTRVRGVLRGLGTGECELNYINPDVPVRVGEIIYTSGADRIFPKGLPIGEVVSREVSEASQQIRVRPFAALDRLDEVLVVTDGVHQALPLTASPEKPAGMLPPPEGVEEAVLAPEVAPMDAAMTDADRLRRRYQRLGEAQGHVFGEGLPGSRPPDFNLPLDGGRPAATDPAEQP